MNNQEENNTNKIKLGKLQVMSKSTLITLVISFLLFLSFIIFVMASCTKAITIEYLKTKQVEVQQNTISNK